MSTALKNGGLKLMVIGLDGATFDVINPMIARGELPNLSSLLKDGCCGHLESTTPPFSAPAWSSFMTGMNPGNHGIFGFINYNPISYSHIDSKLVTAASLAGNTLFDILSEAGNRLAVITVPITYPAWAINGYMVSGEPCPDAESKITYPEELAKKLPRRYAFHSTFWSKPNDEIIAGIHEMDESRATLAIQLIKTGNLDALVVVLGATDRIQHNFWRYYDPVFGSQLGLPKEADYEDVIPETYRRADTAVGRLLSYAGEDTLVLVISDHGGGAAATKIFNTNAWLEQQGLLTIKQSQDSFLRNLRHIVVAMRRKLGSQLEFHLRRFTPQRVIEQGRALVRNVAHIDWSATRAYRFPMYPPSEGIVINVKGRQSHGIVESGHEYEEIRDQIIEQSKLLVDPIHGHPIVIKSQRREEIYHGPYLERAPDIVLTLSNEYTGGVEVHPPVVTEVNPTTLSKVNGEHRMHGILFAKGPMIRANTWIENARLMDIAPSILYGLNLPISENMDGVVLNELFSSEYLKQHQPSLSKHPKSENTLPSDAILTPEEEEQMKKFLERLGYL